MTQQKFLKKILEINSNINLNLIEKAFTFAEIAHSGQKRKSGEDYINHPVKTAVILAELMADSTTIAAGLLHDVPDDTPITSKEIEQEFGKEISYLVNGVTKLGKLRYQGAERQVENLRKMFLAMAEDVRVVLIKLADRLHNIQTLSALPPEKQKRIAIETLEIYAPLAYRLGLGELKGQLEDSAFPYAYPEEHKWLLSQIRDAYKERERYLQKIKPILQRELLKENIPVLEISSRAKHYYSLYRKLQKYDMDLNKIYDLVALRIIVPDLEKSYASLGLIHKLWKPLPGRIKDYIALPKPNGYQSLHTTVFCEDGKITEFQIKTKEMHEKAEYGIAAHWFYSENKKNKKLLGVANFCSTKELEWVKQLREWQKDIRSPQEFLESLKIDFFKDRIFVFTPKGDIVDLPEEATAIDFAYHIHSDIGHQCVGAKADNKLIALDEPLKNGQIIEIIIKKEKGPNKKWLEFVKTNLAKDRIKNWFRK